jgi:hypothetical protein
LNKRSPDAADRLRRARKAAAKELKLPLSSWQVRRFALLAVAHDNITARLASGADVSVDNLLKIDAAMEEIKASLPKPPLKVTVEYIGDAPEPPPEAPPPSPPPAPPLSPPRSSDNRAAPSAPSEQSNVIPLKRTPEEEREHMLRACAPPLKRQNEPWRGDVGPVHDPYGSVNPFGTYGDPIPNFSAPYRGR